MMATANRCLELPLILCTLAKLQKNTKKQKGTYVHLKSNNLQYNTLGRWVDRLIDHASDGLSIILID